MSSVFCLPYRHFVLGAVLEEVSGREFFPDDGLAAEPEGHAHAERQGRRVVERHRHVDHVRRPVAHHAGRAQCAEMLPEINLNFLVNRIVYE